MAIIYIVRHGKTDFNEQGRYLGRINLSLNAAGRQQAEKLAEEIKKLKVDLIISSPLKRAMETAEIIKPDECKMINSLCFVERSVGIYEGLTKKEAKEKFPDLYKKSITRIFNNAPLNGETIQDVQNRVFDGLDKIKKTYQNKNILVVTHAFVAKVINKYFNPDISEQDFFDFVLKTANISQYQFKYL
ncbi:histidine phosphatase family protein [Candidatus Parcubacteria bacterium]|nr:histidine phosphatase family protein [Candidatus Parcubacteria bacterium]